MSEGSNGFEERRGERRRYHGASGGGWSWSWKQYPIDAERPALLHNSSASGLGLLIGSKFAPNTGQELDLRCNQTGRKMHCEVVCVQPRRHSHLSLIGCRVQSERPCSAL